jgi:predicted alpha/beta superfamily hydrolase
MSRCFLRLLAFTAVLFLSFHENVFAQPSQTDRFTLNSADGKISYVINVWLPKSYFAAPRPYPMLLMLDGEFSFNSAVQISEYLQRSGEVEDFIIIGVSYDVGFGKPLAAKRTPDFTPPMNKEGAPEKKPTAYYRFLKDQLLPQLRSKYQIDPANRALWSYSLSGSFAAWLNYFDPSLFDHYILASPNLAQFGLLPKLFQGELFSSTTYQGRKVVISIDASEVQDPQVLEDGKKLLARDDLFVGYKMKFFLTEGETHTSSWFVSLPTSLRHVFGRKPATDPK